MKHIDSVENGVTHPCKLSKSVFNLKGIISQSIQEYIINVSQGQAGPHLIPRY